MKRLVMGIAALVALFNVEAMAADWGQEPLACLPDRAEKWVEGEEASPCHCPPQDEFCPNGANLGLENIDFVVTLDLYYLTQRTYPTITVNAADVAELPEAVKDIFKLSENKNGLLMKLAPNLQPAVDAKVQELGIAGGCGGDWSVAGFATPGQGRCGQPGGHIISVDIEIVINSDNGLLDDWMSGFDMPPEMIGQCCDGSICPEGTVLTEQVKTIQKEFCWFEESEEEEVLPEEECEEEEEPAEEEEEEPSEEEEEDPCPNCCVKPKPPVKKCEIREIEIKTYTCKVKKTYPREGCLIEGTSVMLKDGTEKAIEQLNVGDEVMGDTGTVSVIAINKFRQEHDIVYGINGGKAFFTQEHPVLTEKGWKSVSPSHTKAVSGIEVGPLVIGDVIITRKGERITVTSIDAKPIDNGATVYNLKVSGNGAFTANNVVVKGFDKVEIQY